MSKLQRYGTWSVFTTPLHDAYSIAVFREECPIHNKYFTVGDDPRLVRYICLLGWSIYSNPSRWPGTVLICRMEGVPSTVKADCGP